MIGVSHTEAEPAAAAASPTASTLPACFARQRPACKTPRTTSDLVPSPKMNSRPPRRLHQSCQRSHGGPLKLPAPPAPPTPPPRARKCTCCRTASNAGLFHKRALQRHLLNTSPQASQQYGGGLPQPTSHAAHAAHTHGTPRGRGRAPPPVAPTLLYTQGRAERSHAAARARACSRQLDTADGAACGWRCRIAAEHALARSASGADSTQRWCTNQAITARAPARCQQLLPAPRGRQRALLGRRHHRARCVPPTQCAPCTSAAPARGTRAATCAAPHTCTTARRTRGPCSRTAPLAAPSGRARSHTLASACSRSAQRSSTSSTPHA